MKKMFLLLKVHKKSFIKGDHSKNPHENKKRMMRNRKKERTETEKLF